MTHDMSDYCRNACDFYEQLSGRKLKEAATPFVAEGSLQTSDWETRGQLADSASRVLMKSLWLARFSRPDVMKPLSDLTRRVTCWSAADDKRLYRLMRYLHSTPERSITHTMGDEPGGLNAKPVPACTRMPTMLPTWNTLTVRPECFSALKVTTPFGHCVGRAKSNLRLADPPQRQK